MPFGDVLNRAREFGLENHRDDAQKEPNRVFASPNAHRADICVDPIGHRHSTLLTLKDGRKRSGGNGISSNCKFILYCLFLEMGNWLPGGLVKSGAGKASYG
jgi:hypothetical protein